MHRRIRMVLLWGCCVLFTVAVWYDVTAMSPFTSAIVSSKELAQDTQNQKPVEGEAKEVNRSPRREVVGDINYQDKPSTEQRELHQPIAERSYKGMMKAGGDDYIGSWEEEQARRKATLAKACKGWKRDKWRYSPWSRDELKHLLVDDTHKAIYCFIPKVGCTNWKRLWMILTGMTNQTDPLNIPPLLPHDLHHRMMLINQKAKDHTLESKIHKYKKFLIVRDPYERLVSAFRDKLEHPGNTFYQENVGKTIKKMFKKSKAKSITFSNFVSFVNTRDRGQFDEHWRSYSHTCFPCVIKYDIIGKYETIIEDSERFLRLIGAPEDLHFPSFVPSNTQRLLPRYLASLSPHQLTKITRTYADDLRMFGYKTWSPDDPRLSS